MLAGSVSRRRFMLTASAATLAAGFGPVVSAEEKKIGFAIVGLGGLAMNQILPAMAKTKFCKPVALVSGHPDKAKKMADKYGVNPKNIYNYENYDTLKDNPEVDVIYIVLPNGMHAEYTIRGFKAGKHVLSQKPMATSVADAQAMCDAGKAAGKKLSVGYRCQHEPFHKMMMQVAHSGDIGKVKACRGDTGFNCQAGVWRLDKKLAGGGPLMDVGIYTIQEACMVAKETPVDVAAQVFSSPDDPRFKEVEESIAYTLRFPGGMVAACTTSYGYDWQNSFRAIGTTGWVELEPAIAYEGQAGRANRFGKTEEFKIQPVDHFAVEMDYFAQCITNNADVKTPGEMGVRDLKIMTAIYEAAKTGQVVKV